MELLSAIQFQPFEKVKEIAESMKITTNPEYLDYHALNLALGLNQKKTAEFLIGINCRVNMETKKLENTPLHNAIELGDKQIVCDLLMKKASIMAVNYEGNTPLHLAFLRRFDKITELILNVMFVHKFYPYNNIKNDHGLTHLHIACTIDNERLVQFFLSAGANIEDAVNKDSPYFAGYTAMHFAVKNKCIKVVKLLLNSSGVGIITQGTDNDNNTPVQLAFDDLKNSQILFYHMTMQNQHNQSGYYKHLSQFHVACLKNYPEIVDDFIYHGVSINTPLEQNAVFCPGYTPLHCAVESNCKDNVQLLLQKGADVDQMNNYNMTPLHLALYNEDSNGDNTIVNLLYAASKNHRKDVIDLNNLSYMHVAVTRDDRKTVRVFLKRDKSNVNRTIMYNLRKFSGFTPLHFAVKYEHLEMATLLIKNGANINSNDDFEHGTPLHLALKAGHQKLIDLLLQKGARADISRACDDKTMLHLLVEEYIDQTEARELVANGEGNAFEFCDVKDYLLEYIKQLVTLGCDVNAIDSEDGNTALHLACHEFWDGFPCVSKLLEFGADINRENFYGLTAFQLALDQEYQDNGDDYMMLYHHVQKLKALELEVNPKNEKCCQQILTKKKDWEKLSTFTLGINYFSEEEFMRKHQERLDEVAKMKNFKLVKNISLYDFVQLETNLAAAYTQNKTLVKLFEAKDTKQLNDQYPSYAYLIKLRYYKAVEYVLLNGVLKKRRTVVAKKTHCTKT